MSGMKSGVAVLVVLALAASSGAAWAQGTPGVGFVETSGTLKDGATDAVDTPAVLKVTVRATGLPAVGDPGRAAALTRLGTITLSEDSDQFAIEASASVSGTANSLSFENTDNVILTFTTDDDGDGSSDSDDRNWKSEEYSIKLLSDSDAVSPNPGVFTLTLEDDDLAPRIFWTLQQDQTHIPVHRIILGEGTTNPSPIIRARAHEDNSNPDARLDSTAGRDWGTQDLEIAVSAPEKVAIARLVRSGGSILFETEAAEATCARSPRAILAVSANPPQAQASNAWSGPDSKGIIEANEFRFLDDNDDGNQQIVEFTRCAGGATFRNEDIVFTFVPESLVHPTFGAITNLGPLTVTVLANATPPTVTFATTSVLVDEGGANTVAIFVDGALSDAVGSVDVKVSGEAAITLAQDGKALEANDDGSFTVDLGGGSNAILEIGAAGDGSLVDGATKTATLTFANANDAMVGDRSEVTITVAGATAVPALPLAGQLLLALLLAAGGARLRYRRRGQV